MDAYAALLKMRQAGKRPAGPIFIGTHGPHLDRMRKLGGYVLHARPRPDWKALKGLSVTLATTGRRDNFQALAKAIFDAQPRNLLWMYADHENYWAQEWVIPCS